MSDDLTNQSTVIHQRDPDPLDPDQVAPHFPQLDIIEVLGRGGMGVVYKARQKGLDRLVALKVLPPDKDRDEKFAERFSREARALARLQHANIVMVFDSGQADDLFYFIMEFVDGVNLRELMAREELSPERALSIIPPICDALQYAHDQGIVHRDIKPENILLDRKGRVKIADFGLAKLLGSRKQTDYTLTSPQQVMGTMHYMAPEQIEAPAKVDHRADIYSLGVVFYEMLTGELPIGRFPLPSERAQVDARLDRIVLAALEKEPDRRYQHVSEVKTDVEHISVEHHPGVVSSSPPVAAGEVPFAPPGRAWPERTARPGTPQASPPPAAPAGRVAAGAISYPSHPMTAVVATPPAESARSAPVAYLLWLLCFAGACGIHRLYAGKWISGIIWLLTGGLFLIGQLVDLLLIPGMIDQTNRQARSERHRYYTPPVPAAVPRQTPGPEGSPSPTVPPAGADESAVRHLAVDRPESVIPPPAGQAADARQSHADIPADEFADVYQRVAGSARRLLTCGVLSMLVAAPLAGAGLAILVAGSFTTFAVSVGVDASSWAATVFALVSIGLFAAAGTMMLASFRMRNLESRGLAIAAGILALTPVTTIWWWLTPWLAIGALRTLGRPDVRQAFAANESVSRDRPRFVSRTKVIMVCAIILMLLAGRFVT